MEERLLLIINYYNLNSSKLADLLKVQRSGISHILSGRNKPSYDFLVKILEAFPELNSRWLLLGHGEMFIGGGDIENKSKETTLFESSESAINTDENKIDQNKISSEKAEKDQDVYKSNTAIESDFNSEKIIVLLKNGKFREYIKE